MSGEFSRILDELPSSGIRTFFDLVQNSDDVISLGVGEPDFSTPWGVCESAIHSLEEGHTSYTSNQGTPSLCSAISEYYSERFSVSYDAESEVLVTVGGSEGLDLVLRSLLNPGDEVIVPTPTFVSYSPLVKLAGGVPIELDTSDSAFVPDPDQLSALISEKTKVVFLCSPSNPTGRVIPKSILERIAAIASEAGIWVISDEIYAELAYGDPAVSIASLPNMKDRTVVISGFSKAFAMTGWRLGYMCGPEPLISRALKIHQYCMMCAPVMAQYAAEEALKTRSQIIGPMRKSYEQRRNYVVSELNDIGLPTHLPEGAFYCFPDVRSLGMDSETFAIELLKDARVAVVPGSAFGPGGEGFVRACYATDMDSLKRALAGIRRFVEGRR